MSSAGTVGELIDEASRDSPDSEVVFPDERLRYREFAVETSRMARSLRAVGVVKGDFVGLLGNSRLASVVAMAAIACLGGVAVPINPRLKSLEQHYLLEHSGVEVLLIEEQFAGEVAASQAAGAVPLSVRPIVVLDGDSDVGFMSSAEFAAHGDRKDAAGVADVQVESSDPVVLLYTSGTTAKPRGCLHSHESLVQEGRSVATRLRLDMTDRFWVPLPMHHCGGIDVLMASLAAGCTFCHVGEFDATTGLHQLVAERCTVAFPAFETVWLPVLDHPDFDPAQLEALRLVVNVGTPERMRAMQARLPGTTQISCLGCTESNGFCCVGDPADTAEVRATTSGVVLPHMRARVVDPDRGEDCRQGEVGEFLFKGASRFLGYYRDPESTTARIDADGWFHSGDLVRRDAWGRFSFAGRMGDVLKVGGENVAAAEIEDHLSRHPAVRMAQVVAAPDARYGEVAAAFVETWATTEATEDELIDFCLGEIATFKVPRYVRFIESWPVSNTKIQKFKLRELIATELNNAGIAAAPRMSSRANSA